METKEVIKALREKYNLTQDALARRMMVTRQAVSRWENGDTLPNTDTLRLLSKEFGVSIHTILCDPNPPVCQCCGMPMGADDVISREPDGTFNEEYCKWCYTDGAFTYADKESLLDFLVGHMPNPDKLDDGTRRSQFDAFLSQLKHWSVS